MDRKRWLPGPSRSRISSPAIGLNSATWLVKATWKPTWTEEKAGPWTVSYVDSTDGLGAVAPLVAEIKTEFVRAETELRKIIAPR